MTTPGASVPSSSPSESFVTMHELMLVRKAKLEEEAQTLIASMQDIMLAEFRFNQAFGAELMAIFQPLLQKYIEELTKPNKTLHDVVRLHRDIEDFDEEFLQFVRDNKTPATSSFKKSPKMGATPRKSILKGSNQKSSRGHIRWRNHNEYFRI